LTAGKRSRLLLCLNTLPRPALLGDRKALLRSAARKSKLRYAAIDDQDSRITGGIDRARVGNDAIAKLAEPFDQTGADATRHR